MIVAPRRLTDARGAHDGWRSVVWLHGEHDIATATDLCETLARTIAADDADVDVDVSGVTFMGAETIGVLLRARQFLALHSRSLQLRDPSAPVLHTLDVCDLTSLIGPAADIRRLAERTPSVLRS